jgi:hypothetical protein
MKVFVDKRDVDEVFRFLNKNKAPNSVFRAFNNILDVVEIESETCNDCGKEVGFDIVDGLCHDCHERRANEE